MKKGTKLTEEQKEARRLKKEEAVANKRAAERASHEESQKNDFLRRVELHQPSAPKRVFSVGEKVEPLNANWNDVVVDEVFLEGRAYKVSYNYSLKKKEEGSSYVHWSELRDPSVPKHDKIFSHRDMMKRFQFFNMHLSSIINKVEYFGVDFAPDYQRGFVWELEDKEALVESIFKGRDIGKFVFLHLGYGQKNSYEILDGKQRLSTIMEFVNDEFPYKGVYYSNLHPRDIQEFLNLSVSIAEAEGDFSAKDKYEAFLELNTRGKVQDEEHIQVVKNLLKKVQ